MSLRLRTAVRDLLAAAELQGVIEEGSPFAELRTLVETEERQDATTVEPAAETVQVEALRTALSGFQKSGTHFVGCTADKDGRLCSAACRQAQLALDPGQASQISAEIGRLMTAIRGLEADRASVRKQLRQHREYLRWVLRRVKAETGFVLRRPGRPRSALTESTEVRP